MWTFLASQPGSNDEERLEKAVCMARDCWGGEGGLECAGTGEEGGLALDLGGSGEGWSAVSGEARRRGTPAGT